MAATDPIERVRKWIGVAFIGGLAVIDLGTIPWELIHRRAQDYGVFPACVVIASLVLLGPFGIKIVRRRNGDDTLT